MIRTRNATAKDLDQIDRLQNFEFPGDALLMSKREMLNRCSGNNKGSLLVATVHEKVVAYCVLTDRSFRPWTGWDFLAVDPAYRRLGIANNLTELVFRSANRFFIRGFVRSKNVGALSHYKNWGFVQSGTKREFYSDGDDAIVLLGQRILSRRVTNALIVR